MVNVVRCADVDSTHAGVFDQFVQRRIAAIYFELAYSFAGAFGRTAENSANWNAESSQCFQMCFADKSLPDDGGAGLVNSTKCPGENSGLRPVCRTHVPGPSSGFRMTGMMSGIVVRLSL